MDFTLNEAEVETDSLKFDSDDEDEMECDSTPLSEDVYIEKTPSFYRTFDNREEFANFEKLNLLKGLKKIIMVKKICFELFAPDFLSCLHLRTEKKLTFITFLTIKKESSMFYSRARKSYFFYAIVYGLMYHKIKGATPISNISIDDAEKTLGREFYFELQKIKPDVMLDYTVFGFFNRCRIMNRVLAEFGFF